MTDGPPRTQRSVVAAFDFDHTLTTRDSVVPFLIAATGRRRLAREVLRAPIDVVGAAARRDRDRLREIATRSFAGRRGNEIADIAKAFAAGALSDSLRVDTVGRLRCHVDAGHRVVIVSASYQDYLDHVATELGVEAVLSTRLAQADGICTGVLDGPNCRGAEKARRLESWLVEQGLRRESVDLYAYGDSAGDRELLALADHPTWVRRDPIPVAIPTQSAPS